MASAAPAEKPTSKGDVNSFDEAYRQIVTAIRAGYTGFYLKTYEENRAEKVIESAMRHPKVADKYQRLILWSRASGLWVVLGDGAPHPMMGSRDPRTGEWRTNEDAQANTMEIAAAIGYATTDEAEGALIVLCDPDGDLADPQIERQIRELCWTATGRDPRRGDSVRNVCLIMLGPKFPESDSLSKEMKTVELRLPGRTEMRKIIDQRAVEYEAAAAAFKEKARRNGWTLAPEDVPVVSLTDEAKDKLARALLGVGSDEADNIVAEAVVEKNGLVEACLAPILVAKANIIKQVDGVTYEEPEPAGDLGGYSGTRTYFIRVANSTTARSVAFGRSPAKGILLVGLPGCGKDWSAKVCAGMLGRPLIKFSFSDVMAAGEGLLGKAEGALTKVLAICDVVKPILHISEFEKALGGAGGDRDGGTTKRMIGTILEWMAEQEGTFVIATANTLEGLEPEQFRAGRFDDKPLFVDLPNVVERPEIFAVHLRRKLRKPEDFDLEALAQATEMFSGAEIKAVIEKGIDIALERIIAAEAIGQGTPQDLTTLDLLQAIRETRPLAEGNKRLEDIRKWAAQECIFANTPLPKAEDKPKTRMPF